MSNIFEQRQSALQCSNAELPTSAYLYHLRTASYRDDLPFLVRLAEKRGGEILEIGCGTGRVLKALCEKGFTPYGIDTWPEALLEARKNAPAAIVAEQDVKSLNLEQSFDLVLMTFNVLELLDSFEDKKQALERVRSHLKENGVLCVDTTLFDPELFRADQPEVEIRSLTIDDQLEVKVFFSAVRSASEQRSKSHFRYVVCETEGGRIIGEREDEFVVSPLTYSQLQELLTESGLKTLSIFSSYQGTDFDPGNDTHALILAAAK